MVAITIEVDEQTQHRLERVSLASGIPGEELAHEALISYLEDCEDAREAEAVLGRIERGEESVISLEELERRLGLDG